MSKELIRLRDLTMEFDGERILDGINLYINDHEFLTLLGPSGCGKTTTLRIIGGFLTPTSGTVIFDGECINEVPPYKRQINTVFQRYALFPHLNVFDNIAFGLRVAKKSKEEIEQRVNHMLEVVSLKGYGHRNVASLSGGQQQRVALARALAVAPELILLDEPLSNLDAKLRDEMRDELRTICRDRKLTAVYVTHDRREALSMADRMAVLNGGTISQMGRPDELYRQPANRFTAEFLGDINIIAGEVVADGDVKTALGIFKNVTTHPAGSCVTLAVRPEAVVIDPAAECAWQGELPLTGGSYLGEFASWQFGDLKVSEIAPEVRNIGSCCKLGICPEDVIVFADGVK